MRYDIVRIERGTNTVSISIPSLDKGWNVIWTNTGASDRSVRKMWSEFGGYNTLLKWFQIMNYMAICFLYWHKNLKKKYKLNATVMTVKTNSKKVGYISAVWNEFTIIQNKMV